MKRWVFNIAAGVSTVLCLAILAVGIASYWRAFGLVRCWKHPAGRGDVLLGCGIECVAGSARIIWEREYFDGGLEFSGNKSSMWDYYTNDYSAGEPDGMSSFFFAYLETRRRWGFYWEPAGKYGLGSGLSSGVGLPYWLVASPLVILPAVKMLLWFTRRKRASLSQCRRCGYDLRATPDRCPECGAARLPAHG